MIDRFLLQASWRRQVGCAEDLHYLLEVQGDVVMEKTGGYNSSTRAGMAIKQCPVVKGEIFRAILQARYKKQSAHYFKITGSSVGMFPSYQVKLKHKCLTLHYKLQQF